MFEQDYIMRMLVGWADAIRRSMLKAAGQKDPQGAAELLEASISEATDIDGEVLLSLSPESIASVLQVSGTDPQVVEYISRSLLLEANYLREAKFDEMAKLREEQAYALAHAFGFEVSLDMLTEEEWDKFFADTIPEGHRE